MAATGSGWVIGGEVFAPEGPRAAIWTSRDGRAWGRAKDGPAFDIGGYLDTGEEPGAGGIRDIASVSGRIVVVGRVCDEHGERCGPAAWASDDGLVWNRAGIQEANGGLGAVASFSHGFIAFAKDGSPDTHDPILVSEDGLIWTATESDGFPTGMELQVRRGSETVSRWP